MNTGDAHEPPSSRDLNGLPESLAGFLEMTFDAAVEFDTRERITYWNPAAEQMFGWTTQEALGKTSAKLFWPVSTPDEKKSRRQRQSALKRGETLRGEHEPRRKDGSFLRVQYTARAIFDAEGKFSGSLAVYREVPALEPGQTSEMEQRFASDLRARTEEVETLLNVSPVAIFVAHDPECTRITGNPAGYRLVKLPEQANISKSAPDEERPTYRTFRNGVEVPAQDLPMQKAARLGVEINEDMLELLFDDGSRKFIYAFAKPLFNAQGQSRGAVAAMLDITERKWADEQLEKSNQKLQEILASVQDDFYVIDRDWIFVYANRQFTAKLGKEPEDLIGNNVWEMFPKHIGTALAENFRAAMEKREMRRFEISGQYTNAWYGITVFPSTEGITVLGTDITESKRAEDALRQNETRLRQMIETSLVAIGFGGSTGKIFDANEAFYRLTGYSREEIQSSQLGWNQLTAPEYAELDRQMIATLVATGSAGPYEKEYIRKDGSRIPLLLTMSKLPGRDEHIAFIMDITERKRTENALAQALQELRMHIDNSPLAIIAFDPEFRIIEWSAGAERMFGWRAEEVLGKAIPDLRWVHEDDVERVASMSADMLAGRVSSGGHANRNYRKDGSVIECEWYNSALLDAHGKLISVRSQVLNVTQRKRAENSLREHRKQLQLLNETLEQKVQEKTAEVHRVASDLVQAVQHERHRISHILHDDLQQRIYAIQMQLTFLHDELWKENERAGKEVSSIEKQLAEVLEVTRHISIDLSPPILRGEGLSHAIGWLAAQMRQRYGLPIELQADGSFAVADEALHVLLFNCVRELLFNVVKHAQASQAVVTLQWTDVGIRIEVRDDGRGFPVHTPEQQSIGEYGLQSGLGLSTIRHQLRLFGGRMEIQSEPGVGARIILIVPVTEGDKNA